MVINHGTIYRFEKSVSVKKTLALIVSLLKSVATGSEVV